MQYTCCLRVTNVKDLVVDKRPEKKNYVVIGRGAENPDILQWSKNYLAQGKWNQDQQPITAPYSWIAGNPVTFLFSGITDNKITEQLKDENFEIFHLVEETLRRLVLQYEVPAMI